jgi:hypothetical protein
MDTIYKNYIDLYGNFSHILTIKIDKSLSEDEKRIILFDIYDLINEKEIKKNISNTIISIKWRVYDESDLLHYFTDSNGILSDKKVYEHTKLLLNNIKTITGAKNSDKFIIILSKPLTKPVCLI